MLLPLLLNNLLGGSTTPVPDVVGDSQALGTATLEGAGFVVAVDTAYSDAVAVGDIISQSPAAGVEYIDGGTVTITVSLGPDPIPGGPVVKSYIPLVFARWLDPLKRYDYATLLAAAATEAATNKVWARYNYFGVLRVHVRSTPSL